MADFNRAYEKLSVLEGGYANVTGDRGGETYRGISRRWWPQWEGWKIINQYGWVDAETAGRLKPLVEQFYHENFWLKLGGDNFASQEIAEELFEQAVNLSIARVNDFIPQVCRAMDISEEQLVGLEKPDDVQIALCALNSLQGTHYITLAVKDPSQRKFFRGWMLKRVFLKEQP